MHPDPRFHEIEHKFVVGDDFDADGLRYRLRQLGPQRETSCEVRDVYYLLEGRPGLIYRHRFDAELQHLSVKSFGGDTEARLEVNLDLGQHRGDQQATVEAFLGVAGVTWRGEVRKEIEVFYFNECEIVIYQAHANGHHRRLRCVELEARGATSLEAGLEVLTRWEERIGFADRQRTDAPLVALLYPEITRAPNCPPN